MAAATSIEPSAESEMKTGTLQKFLLAAALLVSGASLAQGDVAPVAVEGAWVRASVQGQGATGAFMKLTARQKLQLVGVSSPIAGHAEVHEMKMEGSVMKMGPVPVLDLPAGQPVELKSGGYHLMLFDLKAPLARGSAVPVKLLFKDAKGAPSHLDISVPVLLVPPAPGATKP
jgi:periplasmic copper chaperone A